MNIKNNNNITHIKDCFGCGACSLICPRKIIDLKLDKEGFYKPYITNIKDCINCGLCIDICAYMQKDNLFPKPIKSYAGWSLNESVLRKSSSGGICYTIAEQLIKNGYDICAVKFEPTNNRAEHYISKDVDDLQATFGSKYIQSYTIEGFKGISLNNKTLIIGTPCQISSLRNVIKKKKVENNFILIDFFCHGIPSIFLWNKYINEQSIGKLIYASWRNKDNGWHDSWKLRIKGTAGNVSSSYKVDKDLFYKLFLSDICLKKSCYSCRFKQMNSQADIRVGDFWGEEFINNNKGVSIIVTYTQKGEEIIQNIDNCYIKEYSSESCLQGQLKKNPNIPLTRNLIIKELKNKYIPLRFIHYQMNINHKLHTYLKYIFRK